MQRTATHQFLILLLSLALPGSVFAEAPEQAGPKVVVTPVQDASEATGSEAADSEAIAAAPLEQEPQPLENDLERIKKDLLTLKRDLVILEEDLLFPASSQVAVFLSMDLGELFQLDAVSVKINGKEVVHHLYTDRQVDALYRGGVQKLFVGNVKQGQNRLTAFFTGRGPSGRDYRRATTVEFDKTFEPAFVELAISDSGAKYQPEFTAAVSD
ncbi:MAG: AraC family transcriptional regulator [Pseudomonadota bacterium]